MEAVLVLVPTHTLVTGATVIGGTLQSGVEKHANQGYLALALVDWPMVKEPRSLDSGRACWLTALAQECWPGERTTMQE